MVIMNSEELSKCGIFSTGSNQIANKIESVEIEMPVWLNKSTTLNSRRVGTFSYFSGNSLINYADSIGRFCMINRDVYIGLAARPTMNLSTHFIFDSINHSEANRFHHLTIEDRKQIRTHELKKDNSIVIGNDVWIATGVQIMPGVTIGDGAIIGAGAIVTKNVPPYTIMGGPAKIIRMRFPEKSISKLLALKWWEYGPDIMKGIKNVTDIEECIKHIEERIAERFPHYTCDRMIF